MEAFTPGVIDKLGFGWDVVSRENPRLIYASVSGYGQTGPYAGRAGYDPCIQAEVGMPPKATFEQATKFGLFTLKAVMDGRAAQLVDLARTNLRV